MISDRPAPARHSPNCSWIGGKQRGACMRASIGSHQVCDRESWRSLDVVLVDLPMNAEAASICALAANEMRTKKGTPPGVPFLRSFKLLWLALEPHRRSRRPIGRDRPADFFFLVAPVSNVVFVEIPGEQGRATVDSGREGYLTLLVV